MVFRASPTRIMAPKHPKRPCDLNQWAKHMVDLATGSAQEPDPYAGKNAAAVNLGQRGGLKGGKARAANMTPERRAEIARKAAHARLGQVVPSKCPDSSGTLSARREFQLLRAL